MLVLPLQSTARLRPGRVHHRPDVVHRRLDRLDLPHAVGQPGSALVEHEHATDVREALDVAHQQRLLPGREQVAGDAPDEDDVRSAPSPITW